ncbi:MAG: hypothetical protein HDR12_06615 [Lachnospiraceae bacterium]|nr:hypothetical protein [Lachnospiraceae bacterium]
MLHILLLILKIVGIIIAVLIGCILLSLCLALFVPVHYRVELKRTEGEGCPPIEVNARITWLLHFINIRVLYPADIYLRVRVLFFTLFRLPEKNKKEKKKKDVKSKGNKKEKSDNDSDKNIDKEIDKHTDKEIDKDTDKGKKEQGGESEEAENIKTEQSQDVNKKGMEDKSEETTTSENTGDEIQDKKEKISLKSRINKILGLFKNIWYTIKGICGKIKEILENIEYYLDIIKSDTFKQAFSLCKGELGTIFNYVKPRKFMADLIIGMDDPAATGQILSYYGILYPLIGNNVTVTGDFDRKRIEGSVFFKGRIKLFTFLKAVIRIYFSKDIKKLLKLFKKEDA